jgi:hypothetical protein
LLIFTVFGSAWVASAGEMIAHYRFDTNSSDSLGKSPAFTITNGNQSGSAINFRAAFAITNPPITNDALFVDGRYDPNGHFVHYLGTDTITNLRYDAFTVSLDFYPLPRLRSEFHLNSLERKIDSWTRGAYVRWGGFSSNVNDTGNILTGGYGYRWIDFNREHGLLNITLNNHAFTHEFSDAKITVNRWHNLICSVDLQHRQILTVFDGRPLEPITLPSDFKLEAATDAKAVRDRLFTFVDGSRGSVFYGYAANLKIFDGSLTEAEMAGLYRNSLTERPKLPKDVYGSCALAVSVVLIIAVCLVAMYFIRRRRRERV